KNPVQIKADSIYIASYHTTSGRYTASAGGFATAVINGSLTALENVSAGGNGLYSYGPSPTLPKNSVNATNYWVDVLFSSGTYAFNLTNITDNTGCSNSGALQTLTVSTT